MGEHKAGLGHQERPSKAITASRWPNALLTLAALFIGVSMKEAVGGVPKHLTCCAIALSVISGISALIDRLSRKGSRGPQTTD